MNAVPGLVKSCYKMPAVVAAVVVGLSVLAAAYQPQVQWQQQQPSVKGGLFPSLCSLNGASLPSRRSCGAGFLPPTSKSRKGSGISK